MKQKTKTTPVHGGTIKREASTGRFVEVTTSNGVSKASNMSQSAVKKASIKRSAALERLAYR
uniref:hypothetical protein n=1 Tax=Pararhizobium sp. IMCC3301 TaxID=3067904 RepID=UPI0027413634|nr:hypothetical protein [Pararhizobium sp. IMCC3301]